MEGVPRYQVRLLPHSPEWEREGKETAAVLARLLGGNAMDIQHVGSTAIRHICAKPILDMAVRVENLATVPITLLEAAGYVDCGLQHGKSTYRLFVMRASDGRSLRHIHCFDQTDEEFDVLVRFRDHMNANPEEAKAYEALKQELAAAHSKNRAAYGEGKAPYLERINRMLAP